MDILPDNMLAHYVTMRIGGSAKEIIVAHSEQDIVDITNYANNKKLPLITIGGGSNIIFSDHGYDGVVLINKLPGTTIDTSTGLVAAGAGTAWDVLVQQSVESGLAGIESLSGIPGTAGAAPVNNIGAYGQEIKETLVQVNAYDTFSKRFIDIDNGDCGFSYRDSMFKSRAHGRYIITKILLQLRRPAKDYRPPVYVSLQNEFDRQGLKNPTIEQTRQTVLNIRKDKLPDPTVLANTGSFFKNPIILTSKLARLLAVYPQMPHYPQPDGREKLAAGWLIDQAGLRNHRQNGFWIYDKQALVIVNESSTKFTDLRQMSDFVVKTVYEKFDVWLEIEPELI